jgi:hypothetical protein
MPAAGWRIDAAAVLSGQQPTGNGAPHQDPQALINRQRDELVLDVASLQ